MVLWDSGCGKSRNNNEWQQKYHHRTLENSCESSPKVRRVRNTKRKKTEKLILTEEEKVREKIYPNSKENRKWKSERMRWEKERKPGLNRATLRRRRCAGFVPASAWLEKGAERHVGTSLWRHFIIFTKQTPPQETSPKPSPLNSGPGKTHVRRRSSLILTRTLAVFQ